MGRGYYHNKHKYAASEVIYQTVAQNIKYIRKKLDLTQEEVSERAGITQNFYGQIERGRKKGSLVTIKRIADALNVETGELFKEKVYLKKEDLAMDEICRLLKDKSVKTKKCALKVLEAFLED